MTQMVHEHHLGVELHHYIWTLREIAWKLSEWVSVRDIISEVEKREWDNNDQSEGF